jgi:hypothetical protein
MKIPGFTAEAAVYDNVGPTYGMAGAMDVPAKEAVVTPQACVKIGPCRVCVNFRTFPPRACVTLRCPFGLGFRRCVP